MIEFDHTWFLYTDRQLPENFTPGNVKVSNGSNSLNSVSSIYSQLHFARWAKRDQVDVFWSPRNHLPLMLQSGIRQVVTVHDLVWIHAPQTMRVFGRFLEAMLMPASIAKAHAILTPSMSTSRDLHDEFPNTVRRTHVTPLAATVTPKQPSRPNFSGRPLFVGTQEPRKNLSTVVRAYRLLARNGRVNKPLTIVGNVGWGSVWLR